MHEIQSFLATAQFGNGVIARWVVFADQFDDNPKWNWQRRVPHLKNCEWSCKNGFSKNPANSFLHRV